MHCLAVSLDSKSNTLLHKIGKEIYAYQRMSMMIQKFHLTLFCVEDITDCENFLQEFQENKFLFEKMRPVNWLILEGKNTDYDYLAIEVTIPPKVKKEIIRLREKNDSDKLNHFDLKPHISIVRAPKGTFPPELVELLNKKYRHLPSFKTQDVLLFSKDFKIVKKTRLSKYN